MFSKLKDSKSEEAFRVLVQYLAGMLGIGISAIIFS